MKPYGRVWGMMIAGAVLGSFVFGGIGTASAQPRKRIEGSVERSVSGPQGRQLVNFRGSRTVAGGSASSEGPLPALAAGR